MKKLSLLLSFSALLLCAAEPDWEEVFLVGETERPMVGYAVGEPIRLTVTARYRGEILPGYFIEWTLAGDDGQSRKGKASSAQPLKIETALIKPGFIRVLATLVDAEGKPLTNHHGYQKREAPISFDGGAAAALAEIRQSMPEPADFDAFWRKQRERLAAVPLKYRLEPVTPAPEGSELFAVTVDCAGPRPVTGYLQVPAGAAPKSLRAVVGFHGYGVRSQPLPDTLRNEIYFSVNAHGFELGKGDEYYREFSRSIAADGVGYARSKRLNADPETAYFNGMALRVMRALEFVKTLPAWNGEELIVSGGSQAGMQGIWAAGLDPAVTTVWTGVPWGCDFGSEPAGRIMHTWGAFYGRGLDYYDAVNHAARIRCPVYIFRVGMGDYTCPPGGVTAFYNRLACRKEITYIQGSTHGYVPKESEKVTFKGAGDDKK